MEANYVHNLSLSETNYGAVIATSEDKLTKY